MGSGRVQKEHNENPQTVAMHKLSLHELSRYYDHDVHATSLCFLHWFCAGGDVGPEVPPWTWQH
jgi:hypothetical protein